MPTRARPTNQSQAREWFKEAVLSAIQRDEGDGLEEAYHALNTLSAYGVDVTLQALSAPTQKRQRARHFIVELRIDPIHVVHDSDSDAITALKEAFLSFCKELNRRPSHPIIEA